jgi:hypothetical protein
LRFSALHGVMPCDEHQLHLMLATICLLFYPQSFIYKGVGSVDMSMSPLHTSLSQDARS